MNAQAQLTHTPPHSALETLLALYQDEAADLDDPEWLNTNYLVLEEILNIWDEHGPEQAEPHFLDLSDHLAGLVQSYLSAPVLVHELSVFTALLHQLMLEAIEHWDRALQMVGQAQNLEQAENGLEPAEWACRLLTIVSLLSQQIQEVNPCRSNH